MPIFYNHKPEFGDCGPHRAESKKKLADEWESCFDVWAYEEWMNSDDVETTKEVFISVTKRRMREEFIDGLEEV